MYLDEKKIGEVILDEVGECLLRAADYIEKHGWCKNTLIDQEGRACLFGAVYIGANNKFKLGQRAAIAENRLYLCACDRVYNELDKIGAKGKGSEWNDRPSTTKEDVIGVLKRAAVNT